MIAFPGILILMFTVLLFWLRIDKLEQMVLRLDKILNEINTK
jgi:hypothetical protein